MKLGGFFFLGAITNTEISFSLLPDFSASPQRRNDVYATEKVSVRDEGLTPALYKQASNNLNVGLLGSVSTTSNTDLNYFYLLIFLNSLISLAYDDIRGGIGHFV